MHNEGRSNLGIQFHTYIITYKMYWKNVEGRQYDVSYKSSRDYLEKKKKSNYHY